MMTAFNRIKESPFLRVFMVVLLSALVAFCCFTRSWWYAATGFVLLMWSIWWLYKLYTQQNKKIIYMLDALENNDSALRFVEETGDADNRKINKLLNRVAGILYNVKNETAQQEKYYELILNSVNTGIVVLNDKGYVYQKNNEALRLLGLTIFTHVHQLEKIDLTLMKQLAEAHPGDKLQIVFPNERGTVNLSVKVSDITIRNEHLRIFALNDINNELDEKEIDSWIRLTRVLTHEIMNSVTPITSLSETLLSQAEKESEEIRNGLHTITTTGKGLLSFVESYRKLTRIPTPEPSLFYIKPFIERMVKLTKHQNPCENITFKINISPTDLIIHADENLVSQVIINLLKNAVEAIKNKENGTITIDVYCNREEEIFIEIGNNGPHIPPEIAEQIFIPFFTTKTEGSGVGLSLSRQIMKLSGGSLNLIPSQEGKETVFVLRFK